MARHRDELSEQLFVPVRAGGVDIRLTSYQSREETVCQANDGTGPRGDTETACAPDCELSNAQETDSASTDSARRRCHDRAISRVSPEDQHALADALEALAGGSAAIGDGTAPVSSDGC
jgi:hypothetical protein